MADSKLKYFALSKLDGSFIVNGDTMDELNDKLAEIRKNHAGYYKSHIASGYYVVKAANVKAAKASKSHVSFDLPLFNTTSVEFQVYTLTPPSAQLTYKKSVSSLADAITYFRNHEVAEGEIRECNSAGDIMKTIPIDVIKKTIEEQILEEKRKRHKKQLRLF